jgi:hypothetical protein
VLNSYILRSKRQALLAELVERKIRMRAEQIYAQRGDSEGSALGDWVQAEAEVMGNSALAPLYWRTRQQYFPQDASED